MQENNSVSGNSRIKKEEENIEIFIQQKYNITIPSLIFEYLSTESIDFEINELKCFYSSFGEVIDFIIKGKLSIVLFKTFISAEICRSYLSNDNFFKENSKKNFSVRWFDYDKDINIVPDESKNIFENYYNRSLYNIKIIKEKNNQQVIQNINNNNISEMPSHNVNINKNNNIVNNNINNMVINHNLNNIFLSPNIMMQQYNKMNINQGMYLNNMNNINNINNLPSNFQNFQSIPNYNGIQNLIMPQGINIPLFMNQNNINNIIGMQLNNQSYNNQKAFNQNINNINIEEKNYGKYTCKYEILIPNDKEFQVARRLIGSKGCNMKKILNECKQINNNENIKLRLRGKGSGYKEGPQNKESEEPLHLCISAKNQEEMRKACRLVDDLLNKIYEEYKKFCYKNNIMPIASQLAKRIDLGNSLHKGK